MSETKSGAQGLKPDEPVMTNLVPVKVEEQPKDRQYSMSLVFSAEITHTQDMMLPIKKEFRMVQVTPFIPDAQTLDKYAKTIKNAYNQHNPNTRITNITFRYYEYLYMVRPTDDKKQGAVS